MYSKWTYQLLIQTFCYQFTKDVVVEIWTLTYNLDLVNFCLEFQRVNASELDMKREKYII